MGRQPSYTTKKFIDAIPGTGGIISALADRVGCSWQTARKWTREYPTVVDAWDAERNKVTDKARHNILKALQAGDIPISKWWLQVMDDEFVPRQKTELTGNDGGPLSVEYINDWRHQAANAAPGTADGSDESG